LQCVRAPLSSAPAFRLVPRHGHHARVRVASLPLGPRSVLGGSFLARPALRVAVQVRLPVRAPRALHRGARSFRSSCAWVSAASGRSILGAGLPRFPACFAQRHVSARTTGLPLGIHRVLTGLRSASRPSTGGASAPGRLRACGTSPRGESGSGSKSLRARKEASSHGQKARKERRRIHIFSTQIAPVVLAVTTG
jgi:hypothetical protein